MWQRLRAQWRAASLKRKILLTLGAGSAGFLLLVLWWLRPFWQLSGQFAETRREQPSRLYGRSVVLSQGGYVDAKNLARHLESVGYHQAPASGPVAQGRFRITPGEVEVHLRSFPTPGGWVEGELLVAELDDRRIRRLTLGGQEVEAAPLEPPLIASYYGPEVRERRPLSIEQAPDVLVQAVLAAEDAHFFRHAGVSATGILRAMWVNLKGGEVRQGGSTLTQQLVKNLYLTHERSLGRKLQESVIAFCVELRYKKTRILEAYLNEIYLGAAGGANLHGMGAAARAYFGKDVSELSLAEAATLAGLIPAPGNFSPLTHPEKAVERRNRVLDRLAELETVDAAAIAAARLEPLDVASQPPLRRRAPYFADAVAAEARARFGIEELPDRGYTILSTLSLADQKAAEEAIAWGLPSLEKGWQKNAKTASPLQAALVSIDPRDGAVLAYVGGREYGASQFDRAGQARRQAGSAFKPVVYATAIERRVVTPSTMVEDAPLTVSLAGRTWTPQNDDDEYAGWVTVRAAVERSLNIPTARVALETGLEEIVATARAMGITAPLEPYPALALGAFEVSPVELAAVYATLAAGGVRPPVHAVNAVFDAEGAVVEGEGLPPAERVLSRQTAYLLTSILQGVIDHGTAAGVRQAGLGDPLAGKTGTSNSRRDSWFGGFAPNRTTVVWVGYDDNTATRLSGSRAALPIWARFTRAVRPAAGYPSFAVPAGIVSAVIDPASGELATDDCPEVVTEIYTRGQEPSTYCVLHRGWFGGGGDREIVGLGSQAPSQRREGHAVRRWLRKIFGNDPPPGPEPGDREPGARVPPDREPPDREGHDDPPR